MCLVLLLNGCGFALRGPDLIAPRYQALVLDIEQPRSELARLLRQRLQVANIAVESAASPVPVLTVRNERSGSRPISINPRARAAQYQLRLSVDVVIRQGEQELLPPTTLRVERNYFEDIANIAGNRDEVALITSEMHRELVNQLLSRLQAEADASCG